MGGGEDNADRYPDTHTHTHTDKDTHTHTHTHTHICPANHL